MAVAQDAQVESSTTTPEGNRVPEEADRLLAGVGRWQRAVGGVMAGGRSNNGSVRS